MITGRARTIERLRRDVFDWGCERAWTAEQLEPYAQSMGDLLGWDNEEVLTEIEDVLDRLRIPEPCE